MYQGVYLDPVMVKDVQSGFDVRAFINRVKKDTTFYKAFRSLHLVGFTLYNDIRVMNREGNSRAGLQSISRQIISNHCRSMAHQNEKVQGDFYKPNRTYRYYTARLYDHLFFTHGSVCNENNLVGNGVYKGSTKYEEQLRMLIFNPGKRIYGIPGLGEQTAIFEEPWFGRYQFYLSRTQWNGTDCYVFTAKPRKEWYKEAVINELKTWFRVSDFAIVARDYSLSFHTWFYDFDVVMNVKLKPYQSYLLPYEVHYKGNWHVFTRPRENAEFTAIFTDFL